MAARDVTIYRPDKQLHMGLGAIWKEMVLDLIRSRELIWRLFLRDFTSRYKQSLLGATWAVINPVITVGVFVFLNRSGIMNLEAVDVPYIAYALVGLTIWVIFARGLISCTSSIIQAGSMVVKINFPKIALVIAAMGQAIVELLVRIGLTMMVFVFYGIVPSKMVFLLPLMIVPLFLLTLGLGFFLALLAGLFRDTVSIVTLLTTYLLFLIPVAYPPPSTGLLQTLNEFNPLNHIIVNCRQVVFSGTFHDLSAYLWSSLFCLALFLVSWRLFHLVETKIPERI